MSTSSSASTAADVLHLVDGDRRVAGVDHVRRHGPRAGQRPLLLGEVATAEDGDDARRLLGGGDVDRGDPGVRDGAAQHRHVQHPGQHQVVGPLGAPGDQPGVLLAQAGLADLLGRRPAVG
jgi:hypothetical protein